MLDGLRDLVADRALVEDRDPTIADQPISLGEIRVSLNASHRWRLATGEIQLRRGREGAEAKRVLAGLQVERRVDAESSTCESLRRRQCMAEAGGSPPIEGSLPRGQTSGYADRDPARDQVRGERIRLSGVGVDEGVGSDARGSGLASVEREDVVLGRVVVDEVAAAADS